MGPIDLQHQLQTIRIYLMNPSSSLHELAGQLLCTGLNPEAARRWTKAVSMLQVLLQAQLQQKQQQQLVQAVLQPFQCDQGTAGVNEDASPSVLQLLKQQWQHHGTQGNQGVTAVTPGDLLAAEHLSVPSAAWLIAAKGGQLLLPLLLHAVLFMGGAGSSGQLLGEGQQQPLPQEAAAAAVGAAAPAVSTAAVGGFCGHLQPSGAPSASKYRPSSFGSVANEEEAALGSDWGSHPTNSRDGLGDASIAKQLGTDLDAASATEEMDKLASGDLSPSTGFVASIQRALKAGYSCSSRRSNSSSRGCGAEDTAPSAAAACTAADEAVKLLDPSVFDVKEEYQELYHWHVRSELKPVYLLQVGLGAYLSTLLNILMLHCYFYNTFCWQGGPQLCCSLTYWPACSSKHKTFEIGVLGYLITQQSY
jgi:hypothetical protein